LINVAATFAGVALLVARLGAQSTGATTPPVDAPATINYVAEAIVQHDFTTSLKDGASGHISIQRFGGAFVNTYDKGDNHIADSLAYLFINYDFTGLPAPLHSVNAAIADLKYTRDLNKDWSAFVDVSPSALADTSAGFLDGGQISVAAGPVWRVSKDLTITAGPQYYTRLVNSPAWRVYADASWAFAPQWSLHVVGGSSTGAGLAYDLFNDNKTVVDLTTTYNDAQIRLAPAPGNHAAVDQTDVTVKLGVRQLLGGGFFIHGFVDYIASREWQVHLNGNSAASFNGKNTIGIGFELGTTL
jgi:hypothetical protein